MGISICILLCLLCSSTSAAHSCGATTMLAGSFSRCMQLPHLSATLHWTLNYTTWDLSLLFMAPPPNPNGWVAWALNPVAPRMVGSQALLAFRRSNGSLAVATVNVSSYYPVLFSNISYEVRDMAAVEVGEKALGVVATMKLPRGTEKVNHVWQVGPAVSEKGPLEHQMDEANLLATGVLNL